MKQPLIVLLFTVLPSVLFAQGVIPGFGDSAQPSPAQNPGAPPAAGAYYQLPNGDLIGPDGKPIFQGGGSAAANGGIPIVTNPANSNNANGQRLSPLSAAPPGAVTPNGGASAIGKVQRQFEMKPDVVYGPDGYVTVKPLADMQDPFATATDLFVPLTPQQVRNARRAFELNLQARQKDFHGDMPTPSTSQVVLDLSPSATPPLVRVIPGNGSVVSFRDITGAAWPIVSFKSFNSRGFEVTQPIKGSNMIEVSAIENYANGNLSVVLQNFPSPIIISTVSTAAKQIDSKVDIQIPKLGPNAAQSAIPTKVATDQSLFDVLYGVLPEGANALVVSGAQAKAWKTVEGEMLVTGALQIISPQPIERTGLGDGFYAYRIPLSRVVLVSQNGTERKMVLTDRAKIDGK